MAQSYTHTPVLSKVKLGNTTYYLKDADAQYPQMPHYPAEEGKTKLAAGWLIEQAGWKGKSLGPVAVHDRQALVLVNKGDASGKDIQRLCEAIQKDVFEQFGIELSPEVNLIESF